MPEENRRNLDPDTEQTQVELPVDAIGKLERRKLIKAAIAAVPIVLTITAGRARAQDTGSSDQLVSAPISGGDNVDQDTLLPSENNNDIPAGAASDFSSEELQILNEGTGGEAVE